MQYFFILSLILVATSAIHIPLSIASRKDEIARSAQKRATGVGESIQIGGNIAQYDEFFALVSIGSPVQQFYVQIDSGSADLLIFGSQCTTCGSSVKYDLQVSTTETLIPCTQTCQLCTSDQQTCAFDDQYGTPAEVSGPLVQDGFSVGSFSPVRVPIGYITTRSGNFQNYPISGIWGVSYGNISNVSPTTSLDSLIASAQVPNMFSLCLISDAASMSIGVDYSSTAGFQWTNVIQAGFYAVKLNDVTVGSTSLGVASYDTTIVDSGTTLLLLKNDAWNAFQTTLQGMCGTTNLVGVCGASSNETIFAGLCYSLTPTQLGQYPTLHFTFSGMATPLTVSSSQYFIPFTQGGTTYQCLGISSSGTIGYTILGDIFMEGYNVAFDRVSNRVGFGPLSTCPTTLVQMNSTAAASSSSSDATIQGPTSLLTASVFSLLAIFFYWL